MHKSSYLMLMLTLFIASCGSEPEPAPPQRAEPANIPQQPAQPDNRPLILAFGNSLTAGYGVPPGFGYPEQLQQVLDRHGFRYRVVNAGISGDTTSGGLARLQAALQHQPSIVILELGANDGMRGLPVNQMRARLEEMILAFQNTGAKVLLAGMTLPRNYGLDYVRSFENVFTDLAENHNLPLIPFFLEGVAGNLRFTLDDGLHPNPEGYRIVTETVFRHLEPLLERVRPGN